MMDCKLSNHTLTQIDPSIHDTMYYRSQKCTNSVKSVSCLVFSHAWLMFTFLAAILLVNVESLYSLFTFPLPVDCQYL